MILNFCAVCGSTEDLNQHHFIPRSQGGDDKETNMLTLCYNHHNEIHNRAYKDKVNHSKLTKEGLERAKKRGVVLGNPSNLVEYNKIKKRTVKKYAYEYKDLILSFYTKGMTYRKICEEMQKLGIKTRNGSDIWYPVQISRLLKKIKNNTIT